ncbi:MAG: L,D-transpeptidase family protein [Nonlabens sp.]|uniref:L,D-transpeptidase family protein n=1 Tax=Nonlabens sp. TaxID=1888209 RepID=UPI003EF7954A
MNRTQLKIFTSLLLLFILTSCKPSNNSVAIDENQKPLIELVAAQQLKKEDLHILIDKSDYTLSVLAGNDIVKVYPVVLGTNPVDDKLMEGDRSTPEGVFGVRDYYPHRKWSKFIWIDYPTEDSWKKHNAAKADGSIPQSATIGGEVGIHGVPQGSDNLIAQKVNWTWGCISLTNTDVNDLYPIIHKNMKIEIVK